MKPPVVLDFWSRHVLLRQVWVRRSGQGSVS
jgi:hypothetical protein